MNILENRNLRYLCDQQRLRIINLLRHGKLSVHDLSPVMEADTGTLQDHLLSMEKCGLVVSGNNGTTVVYSLPETPNTMLISQLKCLRSFRHESAVYCTDSENLKGYLELNDTQCSG